MDAMVLRNCAVFDGLAQERREGCDVLVRGSLITEIAERRIEAPGAVEIDVGGRTLMPGLIDAHVHVFAVNLVSAKNETMPLTQMTAMAVPRIQAMLERGFTSVRDVGGGDVGIRDAVVQGFIAGPRLFVGGPGITQSGGHGDHRRRTDGRTRLDRNANAADFFSVIVDSPDEMRRVVRDELRKGADHIKVMASGGVGSPSDAIEHVQFSPEEIAVAVAEAKRRDRYVVAHTYTSEAVRHAAAAGVRSIEHANFIDDETARLVRERGAYVVPTLVCFDETQKHGGRLGLSAFVMEKLRRVNDAGIRMLDVCARAGIPMGFGTDLIGEMGYAQSREFSIRCRVERPVDVLRSATSVNAAILQQKGRLGVVAEGAVADLIVVDGDPLKDIALLEEQGAHIRVIIQNGALYRNRLTARESSARTWSRPAPTPVK